MTLSAHLPADAGHILATDELLDSGHTRASLAQAQRDGRLMLLRPGYYWAPPSAEAHDSAVAQHRALCAATVRAAGRRGGREPVLAGPSAAIWWGLPWVGPVPTSITVVGPLGSHGGRRATQRPIGEAPDHQITRYRGALVVSPAQAVVDAARLSSDRTGLVIADGALHLGLATPDQLAQVAVTLFGRKGARRARWCVAHADGRAESPGESISRYAFLRAGLPLPVLQVEFTLPDGSVVRVDFYWDGVRLIGEFDGAAKYVNDERGRSAAEVVLAEKRREDALRTLGHAVVRWDWADAWHPTALIARLRALLT